MNEVTKIVAHKGIFHALAAAQAQMGKAIKDSTNPAFRSRYADLASVMDACLPALNANGVAVYQPTIDDDTGRFVETILAHESGETIRCRVPLIVQKNDMQGYGSAVTYARRYGLMCMAGIAPEDDDGNAAAKAAPVVDRPINISADQFVQLMGMIESTASDPAKLAQWLGVKMLEDLNVQQWERAMTQLRKKLAKGADDAAAQ